MLITAEAVKANGYVSNNVLPDTIAVTIRRVQQTMLKKVMGPARYKLLIDKVSASLPPTTPIVPLDAETKELLTEYVQPFLIACVDYRIIQPLTLKSRSKGVGKSASDGFIPADITEMVRLKDQMAQDVESYREELILKLSGLEDNTLNCICDPNGIPGRGVRGELTATRGIKFR